MHPEHFNQSLLLAGRLADGGDYEDALTVLRPLLECELHDVHKSIVCVNMAIIHGTRGQTSDALACYERGVNFERPHARFFVAEQKAAYMAEQGWTADSLTLYERLLSEPTLTDEDATRIRHNISVLQERLT